MPTEQLTSEQILGIYSGLNKGILEALKFPTDWTIKDTGPISKEEWNSIEQVLGEENFRVVSFVKVSPDSDDLEHVNFAVSPIGLTKLAGYLNQV